MSFKPKIKNKSKECELWELFQDLIGKCNLWPRRIRTNFWTRNISNFSRYITAAFVYVNGLDPKLFMEWVELKHLCRDKKAVDHFYYLFKTFHENPLKYNVWQYNVHNNRYENLRRQIIYYGRTNSEDQTSPSQNKDDNKAGLSTH